MSVGKKIGYIRVSTLDQNIERQKEALKQFNIDKYFIDQISGSTKTRPQLDAMLEFCREDDLIYVSSIDRLARNMHHLHVLVDKLVDKNITINFIKEKLVFSKNENNPISKLLLGVIGSIAEFERSLIKERQAEGISIAKKRGKYKGKEKKLNSNQIDALIYDFLNTRMSKVELAKKYNLCRTSIYSYIVNYKDRRPIIQTEIEDFCK